VKNGTIRVGQRSVDEMGHANEVVIYISEADYQRIIEERKKAAANTTQPSPDGPPVAPPPGLPDAFTEPVEHALDRAVARARRVGR
jgi:hypothetical protein